MTTRRITQCKSKRGI